MIYQRKPECFDYAMVTKTKTKKKTKKNTAPFFDIVRCPVKFRYYARMVFCRVIECPHIERAPYNLVNFLNSPISTAIVMTTFGTRTGIVRRLKSAGSFRKPINKSVDACSRSDMSFHGMKANDLDVYIIKFSKNASRTPYGARESLGRCYHTDAGWSS